jgi:hypothetical protein
LVRHLSVFAVVVGLGAVLLERAAAPDALLREIAFLTVLSRFTTRVVGTAVLLASFESGNVNIVLSCLNMMLSDE